MNYFFYSLSLFLLVYGLIFLISPKKAKRIVHVSAYVMPFWIWGVFLVLFSIVCWKLRTDRNHEFIFTSLILVLLFKGLFLIFYPKRKIKKLIEKWENTPDEIKKIHGIVLIIVAFLMYVII